MRFLRKNTAVMVTVGPFYDKTDGVTIETTLTITNERITMTADTDDGSAPTNILDNVTGATSGTDNDLNYITGNDGGMMQLELSAANTNRLGRMLLSITDAANHVPVFHEFMVVNSALYDAFFATSGGAIPNAVAGASSGVQICGSNAASTYASMTVTGSLTVSDGILVSRSTGNSSAITATGNGTGSGIVATSGSGATGDGIQATAASTNGNGMTLTKTGSGNALAAPTTDMVMVKTTNITGFNDIAATSIVSAGAITTLAGAVVNVDTVDAVTGLTAANLDVAVSTRLATAGYTAPDNANIALIVADTNELQTDWVDGGRLDLILDARASQTSVNTIDDFLDTEIVAIKTQTDKLTFTVANQIDSNIQYVNDVLVTGNGQTGTEWGP